MKKILIPLLGAMTLAVNLYADSVGTVPLGTDFPPQEPWGITVNIANNNYYISDSVNDRILVFDPVLVTTTSVAETNLFTPSGIVLVGGSLVVADTGNHQIKRVDLNGTVTLMAGSARGNANGNGAAAMFNSPTGLAYDPASGNIYIADSGNGSVRKLDSGNNVTTIATGLSHADGLAVGTNGVVWIADTEHNLLKIIQTDGSVQTVAGTGASGHFDSPTALNATFNAPRGLVWVGGDTGLLVSDTGNNTIRRVYWNTNRLTFSVELYAGQAGVIGLADNADPKLATFNSPYGLAIDAKSTVLIADLKNNLIREILRKVQPVKPTILPPSGSYSNLIDITITTTNTVNSPTFHYTTDGSDPTINSATFAGLTLDGGPVPLQVRSFAPDYAPSDVASNFYTFFVATPVITPNGTASNDTVNVKIACDTLGAAIYWTIDGSDPSAVNPTATLTTSGTQFSISKNGTLKAKAFKAGYADSAIASAIFNLAVSDPVITPNGTNSNNDVFITITNATPGSSIYWTINGSEPTNNGSSFLVADSNPFTLSANGTLKAKAFRNGFITSQTVSATFNLTVADPTITPAGRTNDNPVSVTLATTTTNAVLYYTFDGSDPSSTNLLATFVNTNFFSFTLTNNGLLKVRGFKSGYADSGIVSANFSLTNAAPVIFPPGATNNNDVAVTLSTTTAGATIVWTIDGSEPAITPFTTNGNVSVSFNLGTNGTLKAKSFRNGLVDSPTASANFSLSVGDPSISPSGATNNNTVQVTLDSVTTNAFREFFWTIDGSDPTVVPGVGTNGTKYNGTFTLTQNGTMKVLGLKDGYVNSHITSANFNLFVAAPVMTPIGGTNIDTVTVVLSETTTNAIVYYTIDGSTPTTNSSSFTNISGTDSFTNIFVTNTTYKAAAFVNGFIASPIVSNDYLIKVDRPVMNPPGGFFPDGTTITLTVTRPGGASIYYTTTGQPPTTNDHLYVGPFNVDQIQFPLSDLRIIQARAFAPNTLPSDIVTGQAFGTNQIGVPRDMNGGIGSTIVVPVVMNLQSNQTVRSLQFLIEVTPGSGAPSLINSTDFNLLNTNDFIKLAGPSAGSGIISSSSYTTTNNTRGLSISTISNANFSLQNFGVVALVSVKIPANSVVGQTYTINVLNASGTSDGQQADIPLTPMSSRIITVTNIEYMVGDSAIGSWYNAGEFGDGFLDNADVNNAFRASLGIGAPYTFSDVFNAMDAYPPDEPGFPGGDATIRFLDWQTIQQRSLGLNTNNWVRKWSAGGVLTNRYIGVLTNNFVPHGPVRSPKVVAPGTVWMRHATVGSATLENLVPGNSYLMSVYVNILPSYNLSGMQFRAILLPNGGAPTPGQIQFTAADGIPSPTVLAGLSANDIICAWSLGDFSPPLQGSNVLGQIQFQVPATAQAGQSYTLRFINPDGAPDLQTQYDLESLPGSAWVLSAAQHPADIMSDEWKIHFFGSLTNVNCGPNADPDHDGIPNWQEFLAGTNPTNAGSHLQFSGVGPSGASSVALSWLTAPAKNYVIEFSPTLGGTWTAVPTNILGDGNVRQFIDNNLGNNAKFYRIRIQP